MHKNWAVYLCLLLLFHSLYSENIEERLNFDPQQIAKEEVAAWKDYYNDDTTGLIQHLSHLVIVEFRLNRMTAWTSVIPELIKASTIFKHLPSNSSESTYESEVLPHLEKAYEAIHQAWNASWDPKIAAKDELDWWIYRRQQKTVNPEIVGKKITDLYLLIYGNHDDHHFERAGYLRAVAARYRDLCQESWKHVSDLDWNIIENILEQSYKEVLSGIEANQENKQKMHSH